MKIVNTMDNTIEVLHGTVDDTLKLLNLHMDLIHAEAKRLGTLTKKIALYAFLLAIGAIPGFLMLMLGFTHWLQVETQMPDWQCELIVAGACILACVVMISVARAQILKLKEGF